MAGTSPAMTRWGRGRGEERLQPQINCEAGFVGIKWDKWDSTGQAPPSLLCRRPMTLPSAHHGAIFAQAPRPVHRTLVRGTERGGSREPSPPAPTSPWPSPPRRGGEGGQAEPPASPPVPPLRPRECRPASPTSPLRPRGRRGIGRGGGLLSWRLAPRCRGLPFRQLVIVFCGLGRRLCAAYRVELSLGKLFHGNRLTNSPL